MRKRYIMQAMGLWLIAVLLAAGAVLFLVVTVERRSLGYLVGVAAFILTAVVFVYVIKDIAASITLDEVGFSALTVSLRRKTWAWSEVTAEHTENTSAEGGPVVSMRHRTIDKEKVCLRKVGRSYDEAMRFAIDHAASRVPFDAAVAERRKRRAKK